MEIKSLLLGSAAALVAVSGAQAADAVIAPEPEQVEYVRVCDMYGAGFFYIPGTEVCLKIGGYIRHDLAGGELFAMRSNTGEDTYYHRVRTALRTEARTETELGTLTGKIQINFNWITDRNESRDPRFNVINTETIERAWVKLGGLLWGVDDSQFTTWTGYASGVAQDGLIKYGPFATHQINYTFDAGNGFSAMAGVEEGSGDGVLVDYTPHVVAGLAYKTGLFSLSAVGAYEAVQDEFVVKGRIDLKPSDLFSVFVMGAWTEDNDNTKNTNFFATWGGEWAIWAGGAIRPSDRVKINAEFGYNELEDWSIVVDANFTVVPGLVVTPGVGFKHFDNQLDSDRWGGYVRTQFTF